MPTLTLAQAIQQVRQSEEVAKQVSLQAREGPPELDQQVASSSQRGEKQWKKGAHQAGSGASSSNRADNCGRCGKNQHEEDRCPAFRSTCNKCKRKGHWEHMCLTKTVRELTEDIDQIHFLSAISKDHSNGNWTVTLQIGDTPTDFKIDTGADASIISEETFKQLSPARELHPADTRLKSPGGELKCLGQFQANTGYKG